MEDQQKTDIAQEAFIKGAVQSTNSNEQQNENNHLIKILTEHTTMLEIIKQELRGEQLYQDETGERYFVQVDKPRFVKLDKYNKPIKQINPKTNKEEYVPNDEAINEVLGALKAAGLNSITPMTTLSEEIIMADLLEIQSKVVVALCIKRKSWGMDKALYPLICSEINTMIQDARYKAKNGMVLRAVRSTTTRLESTGDKINKKGLLEGIPSPFK